MEPYYYAPPAKLEVDIPNSLDFRPAPYFAPVPVKVEQQRASISPPARSNDEDGGEDEEEGAEDEDG